MSLNNNVVAPFLYGCKQHLRRQAGVMSLIMAMVLISPFVLTLLGDQLFGQRFYAAFFGIINASAIFLCGFLLIHRVLFVANDKVYCYLARLFS